MTPKWNGRRVAPMRHVISTYLDGSQVVPFVTLRG